MTCVYCSRHYVRRVKVLVSGTALESHLQDLHAASEKAETDEQTQDDRQLVVEYSPDNLTLGKWTPRDHMHSR